jgi:hypothetical protein
LPDITPAIPAIQPGQQTITVPSKGTLSLQAGAYGAVLAKAGTANRPTELKLLGGTYHLVSRSCVSTVGCSA